MNIDRRERVIAIIPALNEAGKIGIVISRIKQQASAYVDEILVVDDGSTDNTPSEVKDNNANIISHERNRGVGAAMRTGIDYALQNRYDIVVMVAADNQDNPQEINRLLSPILYNNFDFVQGSRYMAGGKITNAPLFRLITTKLYSFIFKIVTGYPISDGTNGFRAFRLNIFKNKQLNIRQAWLDHYELEPYLFYKAIKCKLKVTEAPVTKTYPKDDKGYTGYTKMIPVFSWWSILKPIFLLKLGIKK